jgi:hypothetical protein
VDERSRSFVERPGLEMLPIRGLLEKADDLLFLGRDRVEMGEEEEKTGGVFRVYFLTLNGEVSSSSIVVRVALPATTLAMPSGRRKKGGTPLLQTT